MNSYPYLRSYCIPWMLREGKSVGFNGVAPCVSPILQGRPHAQEQSAGADCVLDVSMRVKGENMKLDGWEVGDKYDPNVLYEIIKN